MSATFNNTDFYHSNSIYCIDLIGFADLTPKKCYKGSFTTHQIGRMQFQRFLAGNRLTKEYRQ